MSRSSAEMPKLVTQNDIQELKKHVSVTMLSVSDELKSHIDLNKPTFSLPVLQVSIAAVAFATCNSIAAKLLSKLF